MKYFIVVLTIAAFLQATFVPVNLVLLILICRCLLYKDNSNYYLCLYGGALLGLLTTVNVGFYSLIFVIFAALINNLRRSRLSTHLGVVITVILIANLAVGLLESLIFRSMWQPQISIVSTLVGLLIFWFSQFWADRFVVDRSIRLKV